MIWVVSACESFWTSGQFASGRRAFLVKNYAEALEYFQKSGGQEPGLCVRVHALPRERVDVFRARQYYLGKLAEARNSLERAIAVQTDDHLGRIFLGLTLAHQGDDASGRREMVRGLQGLNDWIEYENSRDPSKAFWDPNQQIRKEIASVLTMISGGNPDTVRVLESVEWIGLKIEDEVDQVRRDRRRDG